MTENYSLYYFDIHGNGEPIRYIFALTGIPYEDIRIPIDQLRTSYHENRLLRKPAPLPSEWEDRIPYGKVPVLEIGNGVKKIVGAKPICRYLGTKYGLVPEDCFDDSKCDEYMDALTDYSCLLRPLYTTTDEELRAKLLTRIHERHTPKYLGTFDRIIAENNGRNLVGNKLTWADIYLAHVMANSRNLLDPDLLKNYSSLLNLVDYVHNLPAIKAWIEVRPKKEW